jgi:CDP-diacylglycerol--glycerol-3-phosphate 3-phosphatidyltransferase
VSVTVVAMLLAGVAGLIDPVLGPGTLTVVLAVWVLLALFGLFQLLAAVRHSLR